MKTIDVEESLLPDEITRMIAEGVYAADRLPKTITHRPLLYIANTDPHFKPGRHWVVIYFGEEHIEYFDPLGKQPNSIIEDYLTLMGPNGYLRNVRKVQGTQNVNCGQFCLYYAYFNSRDISMDTILSSFTVDYAFNDYIVEQFVAKNM